MKLPFGYTPQAYTESGIYYSRNNGKRGFVLNPHLLIIVGLILAIIAGYAIGRFL